MNMIQRVMVAGGAGMVLALARGSSLAQAPDGGLFGAVGSMATELRIKDLDSSWHRLRIVVRRPGDSSATAVCYTRGQTVAVGAHRFLLAYRPTLRPFSLADMQKQFEGRKSPSNDEMLDLILPTVKADTPLGAWLVDVAMIVAIENPVPFELKDALADRMSFNPETAVLAAILFPVFAQAREKARETASLSNLKQISLAAMMYCQDYDETLPPTKSADRLRTVLAPYLKNNEIWTSPVTGKRYAANPWLSGMSLASIESPADTVMLYEAVAYRDGARAVAFVDGHVKKLSASAWEAARARSHVPAPSP